MVEGGLALDRTDLYIQTKFITPAGHDLGTSPYETLDTTAVKVQKSIQKSLKSLELPWVDTFILHGPMPSIEETVEVWKSMERFVPEYARNLGLFNMNLAQVKSICDGAKVWPATIQNRFLRQNDYDRELRKFCSENGITYQAFSINRLLRSDLIRWLAEITSITLEEALLNLVLSIGTDSMDSACILNGPRSTQRLKDDLAALEKLGRVPAFKGGKTFCYRDGNTNKQVPGF